MSCCNCGQPKKLCRCPKKSTETPEAPQRAYIAECTDCDPCRPCESMVKICSFVTPTLTEGQRFRNSFVYNQEDDSVYYISDDGTPTRFGSSPMFIDNFNPEDKAIPRQTVFDFANQKAYIYDPEGNYITVNLVGGTSAKKLHIYCPVMENYLNYSGGRHGRVKFGIGLDWETQDVVITDDSGSRLAPADLIDLGNDLIGYTIVVHIPQMDEVGPEDNPVIVPEQTFALSPAAVIPQDMIPQDTGYMFGGTELAGESWHISLGPTGADTVIFANAYKGV